MITEDLLQEAWSKYQKLNHEATPEEFAKEIGDAVDSILKAEKPEDLLNAHPA